MKQLIKWYDGYQFNEDDPNKRVLKPVSILDEYKIADYWAQTGNAELIVKTFYKEKGQWRFPDFKRPKGYTMRLSYVPQKHNPIDTL